MGVNVFYSMVKEYAEGLLKVSEDGVFAPDAKLSAILTSSHDIIAGVTGITIFNGAIDSIPSEYMAVAAMANSGQMKALQMLTLRLSDFSVSVPDESQLMLLIDAEANNSNCQIFVSPSESVPLSNLLSNVHSDTADYVPESEPIPVAETIPEPEPIPVMETIPEPEPIPVAETIPEPEPIPVAETIPKPEPIPVAETIPEPEPIPVTETIPEPEPIPVTETIPEPEPIPVTETIPEPEPIPVTETIPEPEPVNEYAPESEDNSKLSFEQIADKLFESVGNSVPEPEPQPASNTSSQPQGGMDFFSGFDDDFSNGTNADALDGAEFLTNSAPNPEHIQVKPVENNEETEYSSSVDIDESNPFYEDKLSDSNDKIAYFAEIPNDSPADEAKPAGDSQPHANTPKPETLSKEELLKQAKKRKKIAKANFSFRKR